jgi:HemY protein
MIRASFVLLLLVAAAVGALTLAGEPGRASITWLGWRADMTAAAAILIALGVGLLAAFIWRMILWVLGAPRRAERARAEARRRQTLDLLGRGFVAVAAGDGSEALRLSKKAAELAEAPGLVRVLAAQSAEAAGDVAQAQAAYTAMLGFPEMRLAGHRGLMQLALGQGARETALRHAQEAVGE